MEKNEDDCEKDTRLSWPEDGQSFCQNPFKRVMDSLFYSYMNTILSKGAKLHNERKQFEILQKDHNEQQPQRQDDNQSSPSPAPPQEIKYDDLFKAPKEMLTHVLQKKMLSGLKTDAAKVAAAEKSLPPDSDDSDSSKKTLTRWGFIKVLWNIAKPTYIHAGLFQLVTVLAQTLYPLAVKEILNLLEENPNTSVTRQGIPLAIALFLAAIIDGVAQERQKFLAFQSGIAVRAATVASFYHHMLHLSARGKAVPSPLMVGDINSLVAIDCQKLFEVLQEGHLFWSCPLSMIIVTILLLITMGPVTLIGMASMFLLVPVVQKIVERMLFVRGKRALYTDQRVEITAALLYSIQFCKMNNYEEKYFKRIRDAREGELKWLRKELVMIAFTMAVPVLTPVIACAITFTTFALIGDGNILTASDTFTTLLLFSALRFPINYAGMLMGKIAQGLEACQRLSMFFARETMETPLLLKPSEDDCYQNNDDILLKVDDGNFIIGNEGTRTFVKDGNQEEADLLSNKAPFCLSDISFELKKGEIMAIAGSVGSGKSLLLKSLIGDVSLKESSSTSSPIKVLGESIAYADQSPFILNATVRENITFGRDYNHELYQQILEACNLLSDLKEFGSSGDLTEIGERGITLSGGQKARVALARCIYAQPAVALLDDVLSALDAATGKWVFEHLLETNRKTDLLSNTAIVLVTHATHFLSRVDKIMVLSKGSPVFLGSWDELQLLESSDAMLASINLSAQEKSNVHNDVAEDAKNIDQAATSTDLAVESKSIMTEEERELGSSSWRTWRKVVATAGGISFVFMVLLLLIIDRVAYVATEWWLASWTSAESEPIERFGRSFPSQTDGKSAQYQYIAVYAIFLGFSILGNILRSQYLIQGGARTSQSLFEDTMKRVVRAPMSYFETTPIGRILSRLTYDVEVVDIGLSQSLSSSVATFGWLITGLSVMIWILPWILLVLAPTAGLYWLMFSFYRKSGADLRRLDSVSRSPVQSKLAEGIDGSSTIRVFNRTAYFEELFKVELDNNTSAMMNFLGAQRWLGARFQVLSSTIVLFASCFVVSLNDELRLETGIVAMLIIWAANYTITLSFLAQEVSETEASMTSVERMCDMANIPQEGNPYTPVTIQLDPSWPTNGELSFDNVSFRYRPGLPLTLKNVSFSVGSGQRVGVVGRTGAGKSSLAAALFRLVELESGKITLDGYDLSTLGLADIRGRKNGLCIITQDPILFSGTLRECLDPWSLSTDVEILEALRLVSVGEKESDMLEGYVEEGGRNYSVGERQLLCLARAFLAKPKVIVMDEATASVDGDTDARIQVMIRNRFEGTTIVTIAHRLNTIMDSDVILVMDGGMVGEFGSPEDLLQNENGLFTSLVNSTGKGSSETLRSSASASSRQ